MIGPTEAAMQIYKYTRLSLCGALGSASENRELVFRMTTSDEFQELSCRVLGQYGSKRVGRQCFCVTKVGGDRSACVASNYGIAKDRWRYVHTLHASINCQLRLLGYLHQSDFPCRSKLAALIHFHTNCYVD